MSSFCVHKAPCNSGCLSLGVRILWMLLIIREKPKYLLVQARKSDLAKRSLSNKSISYVWTPPKMDQKQEWRLLLPIGQYAIFTWLLLHEVAITYYKKIGSHTYRFSQVNTPFAHFGLFFHKTSLNFVWANCGTGKIFNCPKETDMSSFLAK